jgi:hypothetical protein
MAKEMQALYVERFRASEARVDAAPKELQELDARLSRLRQRRGGDPDLTTDELQAAIERAEAKRAELSRRSLSETLGQSAVDALRAADAYRRQIEQGLDGDPRAALKARVILRDLFGEDSPCAAIRWEPVAEYAYAGSIAQGCRDRW